MTMALPEVINAIKPVTQATEVFGDLIPAPPHAARQGDHLVVNLRYHIDILRKYPGEQFVTLVRSEIPGILQAILGHLSKTLFKSVCLSAFLPHADDFVRAYRYNILAEQLPDDPQTIDRDFVTTHAYSEIANVDVAKPIALPS